MNQNKLNILLSKDWFCLFLLVLFVFSIISIVIYLGIPFGADFPQHFRFAFTYYESFNAGNLLPGWSAFENSGYGGIGIRIYPPIAHYVLALTQLITNDWFTTTWINLFVWMMLGSFGIYLFARESLSPKNSLFVGILYAFAPYHLAQFFKDFLYSEFVAAAILPFCFLYLKRVCQRENIKDVLLLACSLAILILSHIPTTVIGVICLGIFAIVLLDWNKFFKTSARLLLSGFVALSATSFYWIKLVTEMGLVNHSSSAYSSGYFSYSIHLFPRIGNSSDSYFRQLMWLNDSIALFTLIFILPLTVFVIWSAFKPNANKSNSRDYLAFVMTSGFAFFMITTFSSFVWANSQFIQRLQFPFRWLSVATLFGCLMFVMAISQITVQSLYLKVAGRYLLIVFLFALFLFNISQVIIPSEILSRSAFAEKLDGLLESESYQCWWTIWSKSEAFQTKEKIVANDRQSSITKWDSELREFEVEAGIPANVRIATFYYPHWQATVNGQAVKIERNQDGTMAIPLPSEPAKVSVQFVEPFLVKIAKIVSLATWLLIIFFSAISFRKSAVFPIKAVQ